MDVLIPSQAIQTFWRLAGIITNDDIECIYCVKCIHYVYIVYRRYLHDFSVSLKSCQDPGQEWCANDNMLCQEGQERGETAEDKGGEYEDA